VTETSPTGTSDESTALLEAATLLERLERDLVDLETAMREAIARVPEARRESARNLVHYVALRQHDLRRLQHDLAQLGLSSLGRSESWVRGSVIQASRRVHEALALRGSDAAGREAVRLGNESRGIMSWESANTRLHTSTQEILGPRPDGRHIYVMVTAPSADEADQAWMSRMLLVGMNVLRVNCAHEGPKEWTRLLGALDGARRETGKPCRVLMDLAGPKIRTAPIAGARRIVTWKPARDELGEALAPARVVLRRRSAVRGDEAEAVLMVRDEAFTLVRPGDDLVLRDARGKKRKLHVREVTGSEIVAFGDERAYVLERARAKVSRGGVKVAEISLVVGGAESGAIDVRVGDTLVLGARGDDGRPPRRDRDGKITRPGVVTCTLPAALDELRVGQRVLFDDGKIETIVKKADGRRAELLLEVVRTQKETVMLRAEKGINLPDTTTKIPALTDDDLEALTFVAAHADAVSLSFVKRPEDVRRLHAELDRLGRPDIGVVLKIETRAGFENLPRLLLEGLVRPPLAVMIARGDLAVEVGFERLAELQEEILWLCEASHVPAIWATQVLDTLARTGVPSRAEVTDAAASVAAECVMLNKGPFVADAVRVLVDILGRMEKHHYKKRSLYRKLKVSTFADRGGVEEPARAGDSEPPAG
jgi:pyruvate kinase